MDEGTQNCFLLWLYLQSKAITCGQTLQHPPRRGRCFREDIILPSLCLCPLCAPLTMGAAGNCSPRAPKGWEEAKCPLGLWESKRNSAPRQHTVFDVCPEQPSPLHSLAPRCQYWHWWSADLRQGLLQTHTAGSWHPCTCSPRHSLRAQPMEHGKQRGLEVNPAELLCPFSRHGLQKWPC